MVSVLQIHVTQPPGDVLVFLTGQVSLAQDKQTLHYTDLLKLVVIYTLYLGSLFLKADCVCCRKRLRRAVSFCRRGVGGLAQRSLSLLSFLSMPTCPQTCKLRFLTPRPLELVRYLH